MRAGTSLAADSAASIGAPRCDEVPHRLDHGHGAPGEHSVGAASDAVLDLEVHAGDRVAAVAGSCCGGRVGDEGDPAGSGLPHEPRSVVGEVYAVEDHLHDDIARDERCTCKARLTRRERAHRVEDVRHRLGAARERIACLCRSRVRVPTRDRYAALPQQLHQLVCTGELRRQRHVAHRPGSEQPLQS